MEFLTDYGLFFAKTLTFVVALFIVVSLIVSASGRGKKSEKGHIQVSKLNEKFNAMREALQHSVLDEEQLKHIEKNEKPYNHSTRKIGLRTRFIRQTKNFDRAWH